MRKTKLRDGIIITACVIIIILLGVNAALIYSFMTKDKETKNTMVASPQSEETAALQTGVSEPISGKDVTLLHDTYISATTEQGNGSITDYVEDDLAVTYICTKDGDEFEQYQTPTDIYGYAVAVDVEGGTSTGGTAHWSGDTELYATKDSLAKLYEEKYRDVFDKMKYSSTSGRNWVYNHTDENNESTTVYVDSTSCRVSQIVTPYLTVHFKYSDKPIDPVYSLDDITAMGGIQEVESKNDIINMAWAYTVAITKYDEDTLNEMSEQLEDLQELGGSLEELQ